MGQDKSALDAAQDRRLLIVGVIDIRDVLQDREDLGHEIRIRQKLAARRHGEGICDMGELSRYAVRIQDKINKAGRNRIARHPVKLGALRRLDDDHAVPFLDRPDPVGSVRAGSRQNHRYRPVLVGRGERTEKDIDRVVDLGMIVLA